MVRSGYSFKLCVGHLREVISRVKEIGWNAAPIADRYTTHAYVNWTKLCKENNLKAVYGIELGVAGDAALRVERRPAMDFWVFLAKQRLRNLHEAIGVATSPANRAPALRYCEAVALTDVVKIAGPRSQIVAPAADLYYGLSPATPVALYRAAKRAGHQFVAVPCNSFPREADKEFYRVAVGPKRQEIQTYPQWIVSDYEWRQSIDWFAAEDADAALANRSAILEQCSATLVEANLLEPPKPRTLREMCIDGAKRVGVDLTNQVYAERLERELAMIEKKQFENYFYILADLVTYAKKIMVVGPARGSSCGSLVCYLLNITSIDPIPYGLIFERFIDVNRADLPDVDIDFSDQRREEAFKHMEDMYGREHVARLGTVNTYQPRSAMNQAAISLKIPQAAIDDVANVVIKRKFGDSRADSTLEDTLKETDPGRALVKRYPEILICMRMEDHPASGGQHAAGVVVTKRPVRDHVAVNSKTNATMCDKYDAEALKLLKIDALGLTQLSVFERTLELIGRPSVSGYLETLPLDDPAAFQVLNERHFAGVFQFSQGSALAQLVAGMCTMKANPIECLEDMIALTALVRPGPLSSGGTEDWMARRVGRKPVTYPHALLEPYIKDTLGIVIYQEQVMKVGRELGGLSWEQVTELRRAMSKSLGKEFFDKLGGDEFKVNAVKKGLPPDIAEKFWNDMCQFGAWAFNRAHAVAYAVVSYWCCWLKAHHPVEFAAATLDAEDPEAQVGVLRELAKEGIDYIPVDPEKSADKWEIAMRDGRRYLVGPLINIKNVGPKTVDRIIEMRAGKFELSARLKKLLANPKTKIDSLYPIGDAAARVNLQEQLIFTPPTAIGEVDIGRGYVVVLCVVFRMAPKDENEPVYVARRGGVKLEGPTQVLNLFLKDDSGDIYAKIDRWKYPTIGKRMLEHGKVGKTLWAISGSVPPKMRMIMVDKVKYLGPVEEEDGAERREQKEPARERDLFSQAQVAS
jgi:DNA polymerase III alpha subunit